MKSENCFPCSEELAAEPCNVYNHTPLFLKKHFHTTIPSLPRSPKWSFRLRVYDQIFFCCMYVLPWPYVVHALPFKPSWFYHHANSEWSLEVFKKNLQGYILALILRLLWAFALGLHRPDSEYNPSHSSVCRGLCWFSRAFSTRLFGEMIRHIDCFFFSFFRHLGLEFHAPRNSITLLQF